MYNKSVYFKFKKISTAAYFISNTAKSAEVVGDKIFFFTREHELTKKNIFPSFSQVASSWKACTHNQSVLSAHCDDSLVDGP